MSLWSIGLRLWRRRVVLPRVVVLPRTWRAFVPLTGRTAFVVVAIVVVVGVGGSPFVVAVVVIVVIIGWTILV